MQYFSSYFKQLYQKAFCRKDNSILLKEIIDSNPDGLFLSCFQTENHKISVDRNYKEKIEINYSINHVFFGNSADAIAYISYTNLPYEHHRIANYETICKFESLPDKIKEKIIIHAQKLETYKDIDSTLENITSKIKGNIICSTFSFPANPSFYRKLHGLFFSEKIGNLLEEKIEPRMKTVKI